MEKDIGIPNQNNEVIVPFLNLLLAEEYKLYTKTKTAHWNIEGPNCFEMHVFLENKYNALEVMIDEIADQIRSRGRFATVSLKDFTSVTQMIDKNNVFNNSAQIFESLINNHESIILIIQQEIDPISNKFKDVDLVGFLKRVMKQHENMARMLKSFLLKNNCNSFAYDYDRANNLIDWQD